MSDLLNAPGQPCHCDYCTARAYTMGEIGDVDRVIQRVQSENPRLRVDVAQVVAEAAEQNRQQTKQHRPLPTPRRALENREYGTRHQPPRLRLDTSLVTDAAIRRFGLALTRLTRKNPS